MFLLNKQTKGKGPFGFYEFAWQMHLSFLNYDLLLCPFIILPQCKYPSQCQPDARQQFYFTGNGMLCLLGGAVASRKGSWMRRKRAAEEWFSTKISRL
jgi:hypothetical protein